MIPQRNISLISNTLMSAGGRRIPEAVIERDYVLAWFLTGLAGHPLREVLAFKGGTALRRCWFEDYRFSEDLDFTLTRPITLADILDGLGEIFAAVETACGLRADRFRPLRPPQPPEQPHVLSSLPGAAARCKRREG
jgi:hypothetical protein